MPAPVVQRLVIEVFKVNEQMGSPKALWLSSASFRDSVPRRVTKHCAHRARLEQRRDRLNKYRSSPAVDPMGFSPAAKAQVEAPAHLRVAGGEAVQLEALVTAVAHF